MNFEDIPDYYELNYNNYLYIITKFSFIQCGDKIFFSWNKVHCWDENVANEETFIEGETIIDAYGFTNDAVKNYI